MLPTIALNKMRKYKRYSQVFGENKWQQPQGSVSIQAQDQARERGEVTTALLAPPSVIAAPHLQFQANLDFKKHVEHDPRPHTHGHDIPVFYDQRVLHPLTARVYDQGNCGSCWSISVLSAMEDKCILKGTPVTLNADIARRYTSDPCKGGNAAAFLRWLVTNDAFEAKCHLNRFGWCDNLGKLKYVHVKPSSIRLTTKINNIKRDILKNGSAVAGLLIYDNFKHGHFGPHGIYLDAVQNYNEQGRPVFAPLHNLMGGHSVVIVGWGEQEHVEIAPGVFERVEYWLCRNSWGQSWGQQGHFKIATGHHNKTVRLEHFYHHKGGQWGGVLTFKTEPLASRYPSVYYYILAIVVTIIFAILLKLKFKTFHRKY